MILQLQTKRISVSGIHLQWYYTTTSDKNNFGVENTPAMIQVVSGIHLQWYKLLIRHHRSQNKNVKWNKLTNKRTKFVEYFNRIIYTPKLFTPVFIKLIKIDIKLFECIVKALVMRTEICVVEKLFKLTISYIFFNMAIFRSYSTTPMLWAALSAGTKINYLQNSFNSFYTTPISHPP